MGAGALLGLQNQWAWPRVMLVGSIPMHLRQKAPKGIGHLWVLDTKHQYAIRLSVMKMMVLKKTYIGFLLFAFIPGAYASPALGVVEIVSQVPAVTNHVLRATNLVMSGQLVLNGDKLHWLSPIGFKPGAPNTIAREQLLLLSAKEGYLQNGILEVADVRSVIGDLEEKRVAEMIYEGTGAYPKSKPEVVYGAVANQNIGSAKLLKDRIDKLGGVTNETVIPITRYAMFLMARVRIQFMKGYEIPEGDGAPELRVFVDRVVITAQRQDDIFRMLVMTHPLRERLLAMRTPETNQLAAALEEDFQRTSALVFEPDHLEVIGQSAYDEVAEVETLDPDVSESGGDIEEFFGDPELEPLELD